MIIAVDFDGVLTPNGHWPDVGEPNIQMFEWLKFYRELGGKLILWTNRTGAALENAVAFCKEQGLEFDTVNKNLPEVVERFKDDGPKVTADLYIDDKAAHVEFRGGVKADE